MTALEIFRLVAKEFETVSDDEVNGWIALTKPLISKRIFGQVYNQAVSLLTAHRMKVSGSYASSDEVTNQTNAFGVSSYSEGDTSVSVNVSNISTADDSWYALTSYGLQFLELRRLYIIPIRSAGER